MFANGRARCWAFDAGRMPSCVGAIRPSNGSTWGARTYRRDAGPLCARGRESSLSTARFFFPLDVDHTRINVECICCSMAAPSHSSMAAPSQRVNEWLCTACGHIGHRAKWCWLVAPTLPPSHDPPSFPKNSRPPPPDDAGKEHKGSLQCHRWLPWKERMQLRLYDDRFCKAMRAWDNWAELVPRLMERRRQRCARSACMYVHLRAACFLMFLLR